MPVKTLLAIALLGSNLTWLVGYLAMRDTYQTRAPVAEGTATKLQQDLEWAHAVQIEMEEWAELALGDQP